jgi:hypothetical protein
MMYKERSLSVLRSLENMQRKASTMYIFLSVKPVGT